MKLLLLMPGGQPHKLQLGPWARSFREAPLTLTTLAALVPPELHASVRLVDASIEPVPLREHFELVAISCMTGTSARAYALADHFRAFDTICSATQDRQDAVVQLLKDCAVDLMVVIGGYNSSNTLNLAKICADRVPTYHVADDDCLVSADEIRHRPVDQKAETATRGWLPPQGPVCVGLTAGASTPDNLVGATILKISAFAGPGAGAR